VLVVDPPVLLADEPGASLDIRHRIDLVQVLAARARERLSVVVMHDLDLAFRFFDRVIVVEGGRIAADGPARELINDPRLDATFNVTFERLPTAQGLLLRAV
jgi:ABC-type cobalamin/Fe3+-siderophores transport system ATPase subunit